MPSGKPRIDFVADREFIDKIDKWAEEHDFKSRKKAIVWMIQYVLREKPTVPPPEERALIYYPEDK